MRFSLPLIGGSKYFFFIDAVAIVWGAYTSASALVVYLLANKAICSQYESFNNHIKKRLEDGSILVGPAAKIWH